MCANSADALATQTMSGIRSPGRYDAMNNPVHSTANGSRVWGAVVRSMNSQSRVSGNWEGEAPAEPDYWHRRAARQEPGPPETHEIQRVDRVDLLERDRPIREIAGFKAVGEDDRVDRPERQRIEIDLEA